MKQKNKAWKQTRRNWLKVGASSAAALALTGCGIDMKNSPFETNVAEERLNEKNLQQIYNNNLGETFKVALLSDSHFYFGNMQTSINEINQRDDIDFVIHGGDLTNIGDLWEFETAMSVLKTSRFPVLAIPGNHDFISKGKDIYRKAFGEFNYYLKLEKHLLIFANSNKFEFQAEGLNIDWFIQTIEEHKDDREVIVVAHIPPWDHEAFTEEEHDQCVEKLKEYGVKLFIHGHYHDYSK